MKINHITILVKDNFKALDFYVSKLGFKKKIINDNHCWAKIGDIYIHLAKNSGLSTKNSFQHFAICVENLSQYIEKLRKNCVDVEIKDKQYFIHDIDGNLIELIDENNKFFNPEKK